jgi:hypothetical protein
MHIDGGLWYDDSGTWKRKRGVFGAFIYQPSRISVIGSSLFVAVTNAVLKIDTTTGSVTRFCGIQGSSGTTDATGTDARFGGAIYLTNDGTDLYASDAGNHRIRKITVSSGAVITIAGAGAGSADGTGTAGTFNGPAGITYLAGKLFVADNGNNRIRVISGWTTVNTGVVVTIAGAGAGSADGTGTAGTFSGPLGITSDGGSYLYVTDYTNNRIRRVTAATTLNSGAVITIAGAGAGSADGTGTAGTFTNPAGITYLAGSLYVCELENRLVRKVGAPLTVNAGVVTTIAGVATVEGSADGIGTAATFNHMYGLANNGTDLFICDTLNNMIRKLYIASSYVVTLSGFTESGSGSSIQRAQYADGIFVGPT